MADISVYKREAEAFDALLERLRNEEKGWFEQQCNEYVKTHPNASIKEAFMAGHKFADWHPSVDCIHIVTMFADDYVRFSKLKTEHVLKTLPKLFRNKPVVWNG